MKNKVQKYVWLLGSLAFVFSCQSIQRKPSAVEKGRGIGPFITDLDSDKYALTNPIHDLVQLENSIQILLQAHNVRFDRLFQRPEDARKCLQWLMSPQTELAKREKNALLNELAQIEKSQEFQNKLIDKIHGILVENNIWTNHLTDDRALGFKMMPDVELRDGPRLGPYRKIRDDEKVGDFGKAVREVCFYEKKDLEPGSGALDLFRNIHFNNMGCAFHSDNVHLLPEPEDGLIAKIELLTGSKISKDIIREHNPDYKLDFSKAPKMDAVLMGYLEFKHDFSGKMMAQAIKWHADHGAEVRILVPGLPIPGTNFVHPKDQAILDELSAHNSHIKVQKYKFKEKNPDATTPFHFLQRTYHSKALVALSSSDPEKSGAVVGGRNIKDTFYLKERPDYSSHPEMIQYGGRGEPFAFYRDLEIFMQGREIAEQVASEYMAFWTRDMKGPQTRRMSHHVHIPDIFTQKQRDELDNILKSKTFVRYFVHTPYAGDRSLEHIYATLIDSAKSHIRMTSPYVRPTGEVSQAIRNAARRGVYIDFISGISLDGDNVPPFTADVNKSSFNRIIRENEKDREKNEELKNMVAKIQMYAWNEMPSSILHSKTMMIDDDVLYIGSANMDLRTFRQDVEDGFLVTGPMTKEYRRIFDDFYLKNSTPVDKPLKTNVLYFLLIKLLDVLKVE